MRFFLIGVGIGILIGYVTGAVFATRDCIVLPYESQISVPLPYDGSY